MELFEKQSCSFQGRSYSDDSEVCDNEKCMICDDGNWVQSTDLFPPKKSGIFSP